MERRKALAIAGTVTATLAAAGVAMAANFGLLGFAEGEGQVGKLDAQNVGQLVDATSTTVADPGTTTTLPPDVQVVYEDIPVPVPAVGAPSAPSTATPTEPATSAELPASEPQGGDVTNVGEVFDDHGGDDHADEDTHVDEDTHDGSDEDSHADEDNSGPGSSGSGHDDDD